MAAALSGALRLPLCAACHCMLYADEGRRGAQSPKLASVNSIDEAIVIGAALSLSSSAFVLQLMAERNELGTKFGSATLGILLFQACHAHCKASATALLLCSMEHVFLRCFVK